MADNFVKKFMRYDEVAAEIGVHVKTVRRWIDSGTTCLQVVEFNRQTKRITGSSLQMFITSHNSENFPD